jgi:tRNA A37 methylthiotransferase MiaB
MTTYRVGADGATVFTEDGKPLYKLAPGQVVVPGYSDRPGTPAASHVEVMEKRVRQYSDKRLRATEDK